MLGIIFLWLLAANTFYFAGPLVDVLADRFLRLRIRAGRYALFAAGLIFSLFYCSPCTVHSWNG